VNVNLICPKCGGKGATEIRMRQARTYGGNILETWRFYCKNCNYRITRSFEKRDDMFYWPFLAIPFPVFLIAIHKKTWSLQVDILLSIIGSIVLVYIGFLVSKVILSKILQKRVNLIASEPA